MRSWRRIALNEDRFAPIVAFHWRIGRKTDSFHSWNRLELLLYLVVKCLEAGWFKSGALWIDMDNDTVGRLDSKVLMFQLAQSFGQQAGRHQQYERQRCLQYYQRTLQQ